MDVQASLLGGSNKGGRLIFDEELDCKRFGDPKNRLACDGLDDLRLTWSAVQGDMERASRLIARKSRIGLGDLECCKVMERLRIGFHLKSWRILTRNRPSCASLADRPENLICGDDPRCCGDGKPKF